MRALKPFHSIVERFPAFRNKDEEKKQPAAPTRVRTSNNVHDLIGEAEDPPHELDRAHYVLANSLDMLELGHDYGEPFTPEQRANLPEIVVNDAQDLAARILPAQIADLLQLHSNNPETVASAHFVDETAELCSLYLLIHAYDATHNSPLKHAIEYIMKEMTPRSAEMLQEAYRRGVESGESIIDQFRHLNALISSELEDNPVDADEADLQDKLRLLEVEPGAPDTTRAVGIAAMKATTGRKMDPFVKTYLKDIAQKQRVTRTQHASHSSK